MKTLKTTKFFKMSRIHRMNRTEEFLCIKADGGLDDCIVWTDDYDLADSFSTEEVMEQTLLAFGFYQHLPDKPTDDDYVYQAICDLIYEKIEDKTDQ